MTGRDLPPDADGAPPGWVADQPEPAQTPGGLAPHVTSPVAIASIACGTGALVLSVVFGVPNTAMGGGKGLPSVSYLAVPLGICACFAAVVLGVGAFVQIRRTGQRGFGLAVAGIILGIATPLLWVAFVLVLFAVACQPPAGC